VVAGGQVVAVADGRGGGAEPRGEPRTTARCARCHWGFSLVHATLALLFFCLSCVLH
jgi:hypothetical protein